MVAEAAVAVVIKRFLLQWHITERCDLRCRHCYQEDQIAKELSIDELVRVWEQYVFLIDNLCQQATVSVQADLSITGGEPLLHPDFFPLIETIKSSKTKCRLAILTNGTQITHEVAKRFSKMNLRYVQVSIDGTQATHDAIRGKGSFEAAIRGVRHLVRQGVFTILSMTVHRENFREFSEVVRLGQKLKVNKVWSDRLVPFGRGSTLEPLDKGEVQEWLQIMSQAKSNATRRFFFKNPGGSRSCLAVSCAWWNSLSL